MLRGPHHFSDSVSLHSALLAYEGEKYPLQRSNSANDINSNLSAPRPRRYRSVREPDLYLQGADARASRNLQILIRTDQNMATLKFLFFHTCGSGW